MTNTEKTGLRARYQNLSSLKKAALWGGACLLAYTLLGFFVAPLVVRTVLEKKLPPLLHRPVAIGRITFDPFRLEATVEDFHLGQKEGAGDLVAFDRLAVNLEAASLFKRALIIEAVSLTGPRLEFSRLTEQSYSFSDLLAGDAEKKPAPSGPTEPFQFAIHNIEISGGRIVFHDLPKKTDHLVADLHLGIPALSNQPYQVETYVQPAFSATINGTPFALGGQSKPFARSLETELALKASGINIPEYLAYIPNPTGLALKSARLDIDARLRLLARPGNSYRLALVGRLALRDLAVTDQAGRGYLRLPELAVVLADSDLLAREVHLTELALKAPAVELERLADGRLLPLALLSPATVAPAAKETTPPEKGGGALNLTIDKLLLSDGRVDFLDAAAGARLATRLDLDTSLSYQAGPDTPARLAVLGQVGLKDLALAGKGGKSYLNLPELALTLGEANLLANEVHVSQLTLQTPAVNLERLADGRLLPVALFAQAGPPPAKPEAQVQAGKGAKPAGPPLKLTIDKLALNNGRVDFLDGAVTTPARLTLRDLGLEVEGLSNAPGALARLALAARLNEAGRLKAGGQLGLEPFQTRLNLQLADLALKPFQPYISEQARLAVAGGKLAVSGDLALTPKTGGGLRSDFQGEASLANLATVDTVLGEDLIKWRSLALKKILFASDPGTLSIAAINLSEPYVNARFGKDGVLNLAAIRPEKAPAATPAGPQQTPAPPSAEGQPFVTEIGGISLGGGRLDFLDRQVEPAYGASLSEISGTVSDLSSMEKTSAAVEFAARLDRQAPLKITGRINPLLKNLFVDLKVDFTDINLSPMSPYSGKYIGYQIDKGKLNLDLKYDIADRKLNGQNRIFLDQFTLGRTVESPDATNLPVRLALALLRDRKGGINLDLPVEGSLDDPSFRVGKVVIQVLINLIGKAATSPIALLGALIPQGQDIQAIAFAPGRAEFAPEAAAKLATVEKVLFERPELRMELLGKVEPVADRAALARQRLLTSVKLRKLLAGGQAGSKEAEAQVDGVELSEAEYPALLAQVYQAAHPAPKAGAEGKSAGPAPGVAAMEEVLLGEIKVGEAELRLLALARANQVLNTLVAGGKVEAGRLFVVEPRLAAAGDATAATQVELVIK